MKRTIEAALFLIDFDTMEVVWSSLDLDPAFWHESDEREAQLASFDGGRDDMGAAHKQNCRYVYVKL